MEKKHVGKNTFAVVKVDGVGAFRVPRGLNLREALRREGLYLDGTCADQGTCGRCVVRVVQGESGQPSAGELGLLGEGADSRGLRLACRVRVEGDLVLEVGKERILDLDGTGRWKEVWDSPLWEPEALELSHDGFGVAVDLGTTSIAAALYDLSTGTPLDINSSANPQMPWGEEIISRLDAARSDEVTAVRLRDLLWRSVGNLVKVLCRRSGVSPGRITRMVAVANSAVHHLALGLPVSSLLVPPYSPHEKTARSLPCSQLPMDLRLAGKAHVHFPPLVGGFAGSDALASLVSVGPGPAGTGALMDVGTNTEIMVWSDAGTVLGTAPSGPAFEGGHMRHGMRAEEGAIWKVEMDADGLRYEVLGNVPPVGVCGTGIVDAVAAMLSLGVLEPTGLMKMGSHPSVDARGLSLDRARGIVLEAADVATVQKAKAAIAATMKTLLAELGIGEQDLQRVFLSGAFGSRLHPGRASDIGLLPAVDPARFVLAGNTALVGASMILLSEKVREAGEDLARKVRHLSVAEDSRFETFFLDSLYFPRPSIRKQAE